MNKTNAGIDYGNGLTNIDTETGIRYGVISQNEVLQAWADSSQPFFGDMEDMTDEEKENVDLGYGDPISYFIDDGEYLAECRDNGDIFITKSPFYTLCRFCSPCAPGAGYLMSPNDKGIKAYCFGHDWFDDEQAPYKVYDVKTGMEVKSHE